MKCIGTPYKIFRKTDDCVTLQRIVDNSLQSMYVHTFLKSDLPKSFDFEKYENINAEICLFFSFYTLLKFDANFRTLLFVYEYMQLMRLVKRSGGHQHCE